MKRDMDVVRKLLFYFEEKPDHQHVEKPEVEGCDEPTIQHHLILMFEAGLLRCEPEVTKTGRIIRVVPFTLTWKGFEFLDRVRQDSVWQRLKAKVQSGTGGLAYSTLNELAKLWAAQALGLPS